VRESKCVRAWTSVSRRGTHETHHYEHVTPVCKPLQNDMKLRHKDMPCYLSEVETVWENGKKKRHVERENKKTKNKWSR
jgi:hypothetical protein